MTDDDRDYVCGKIDNEGFDYCFINYSNFEEIKDVKFHKLREEYIQARNKLANYLDFEKYLEEQ
jgi:hypothetical protein